MYFRTLVLSAFVIALGAGTLLSLYQALLITPIIVGSEVYEVVDVVTSHHQNEGAEIEVWAPEDGIERHSWNFTSNYLLCFAYALILLSMMSLKAPMSIGKGFYWGGAAFLTIFAAPAIGLPPEIPGMEAAYLEGRQVWWIVTVLFTGIACWMIAFENNYFKVLALVLIVAPHLLGAPQPEIHGFANTDGDAVKALTLLWHKFILQSSIANALLWGLIGTLSSFVVHKYIEPMGESEKTQS